MTGRGVMPRRTGDAVKRAAGGTRGNQSRRQGSRRRESHQTGSHHAASAQGALPHGDVAPEGVTTPKSGHNYVAYYSTHGSAEAHRLRVRAWLGDGRDPVALFVEARSGNPCAWPKLYEALIACRLYSSTLIIPKLGARLAHNEHFLAVLAESGVEFVVLDNVLGAAGRPQAQEIWSKHALPDMIAAAQDRARRRRAAGQEPGKPTARRGSWLTRDHGTGSAGSRN